MQYDADKVTQDVPKKKLKCLVRLMNAEADFVLSASTRDSYRSASNDTERYMAFSMMVICYWRPFGENNGLEPLERKNEFVENVERRFPDAKIYHSRMRDIRNKFIGHSSSEGVKAFVIAPGSIDPKSGETSDEYIHRVGKRVFKNSEFAEKLFDLVDAAATEASEQIRSILQEIGPNCFPGDHGESYELPTLADNFKWTSL